MHILPFAAALTLVSVPFAAHADDLFVLQNFDHHLEFILPSSPVPLYSDPYTGFTAVASYQIFDGTVESEENDQIGFNAIVGGFSNFFYFETGPKLFYGPNYAPTFYTGTFSLYYENGIDQNATLTVTPIAATPELSSVALLATGMLGMAGVIRKRLM